MSLLYDCMIVTVVSIWVIFTTVNIVSILRRVEKLEDWRRKKESE